MVLQRGISDPVWGWTTAGATVTVTATGVVAAPRTGTAAATRPMTATATATADTTGKWTAKLPPLPVGGPYTVSISGPQTVTLTNVLVGDVWICSGQSNMEFGVGNLTNADQEFAAANYPNIRLYTVPHAIELSPKTTTSGTWEVCTPDNLRHDGTWGGFTAVGYFFGRDLHLDLHVPIGLIHTSWGGTPAQAWTSEAALLDQVPDFRPQLSQLAVERAAESSGPLPPLSERLASWYVQNDPGSSSDPGWADPNYDDSTWQTMTLPVYTQNSGLPEFAGVNGVFWFRRSFDLPAGAAGKDMVLHFVADDDDTTWVNGVRVGATQGYQTPRAYRIPAGDLHGGHNVVAVRVLDTGGVGGIYAPADGPYLDMPGGGGPTAPRISLSGPWRSRLGVALTSAQPIPQQTTGNPNLPTVLYNGMIAPLLTYGIKGAIWYQGESNAGQAYQYRTLLPAMISSWRDNWDQGSFPFLIVQLAGFGHPPTQPGDSNWAELREAQFLTATNVPNTGIATAVDIGNPDDIHPKNKQEVGRRLALVAEALVYHKSVAASGPVYHSMKVEGNKIRVHFDDVDGGLIAKGATATPTPLAKGAVPPPAALTGFAIAGADQRWAWADAHIDGNSVVVSSPAVPKPVAVRYSWADYLDCNLYNRAGLPAFPFRTDNWAGITVNNK